MQANYLIDEFEKYGHIVWDNLLPNSDIKNIANICGNLPYDAFKENNYFKLLRNHSKNCDAIKALAFQGIIPSLARKLLDTQRIRFLFDNLILTSAGSPTTPWHQDQLSLCIDNYNLVTFWIPLMDITQNNGMICFAYNEALMNSPNMAFDSLGDDITLAEKVISEKYEVTQIEFISIGGMSAHSGWTPHSSTANIRTNERMILNLVYLDGDARISRNKRNWEASRDRFFPNKQEGDLIDNYPLVE